MSWTVLCNLLYGQVCCWQCVLSKWPSFQREKTSNSWPSPTPAAPTEVSSQVLWPITPKPGLEPTNLVHPSSLIEIQQLRILLVTKGPRICIVQVSHLLEAKPTKGFACLREEHPELWSLEMWLSWTRDVAVCCAMLNTLWASELPSQQPGKCCQGHPVQSASEGGETSGLHLPACWVSHSVPWWLKVSY